MCDSSPWILVYSALQQLGSHLLDVDRLCKDLGRVLLLQLLQGGAEEHQHRRQLQLQGCLVNFDLQLTRCVNVKKRTSSLFTKNKSPSVLICSGFDCISKYTLHFYFGFSGRMCNSSVSVTCSRFSFSLFRMSSTRSRAFSKSCRSFCQYLSASLAAETFSSTSGLKKERKYIFFRLNGCCPGT